jgi:transposase
MSLRLQQPVPPVPDDTARIARAAFPRGNPYVLLRDRLGPVFDDAGFADLYPPRGQPGYTPWRLALVTLMQFREGLSDRQAAEAVRARIDWKYLLALELADAGFDHTVLCEFRARLLAGDAAERLLGRMLDVARDAGLLKARGRQRTDSTHVLAAVRTLNRIELLAETLRAALNAIAGVAPDWLRALAPPEWHERYDRRIEDMRLPETGPQRDAYVAQVGADGYRLLKALEGANAPPDGAALPAVVVLRRVWARHFEREEARPDNDETGNGVRLRPVQGRGPGDRIESPYDTDARFRSKAGMSWTGYMVHLTETCGAGAPRLVVHADTTAANVHEAMVHEAMVHEAMRTARIHEALAAKGLAPCEHLVDSAYVSADDLISAHEQYGIDLVGPARADQSWQSRAEEAFSAAAFAVDWDRRVARCPEGKESTGWFESAKRPGQRSSVRARFRAADCRACASRTRCTRARSGPHGRVLALLPKREYEALAAARARESTAEGRRLYAQRQGVESTLSQGVRAFGLRQARYRGLAKTGLQNVATAAALNLDRLAAWLAQRPLAPTRISRFAALMA